MVAALLVAPALALNGLAYGHARALTHFVSEGTSTQRPEELSFGQRISTLATGVRVRRPENTRTPRDVGLSFTTVRQASEDGVELELWYVPRAELRGVVVLGHGYAGSKSSLLEAARAFHELGFACLLLDFRGCGGSAGNVTTLGVHEARDIATATRLARERFAAGKPVVLFGASMGAAASLRAIHLHDVRPDALILESTFDRLDTTVRRRFSAMGVPAFPAADLLLFWGGVQGDLDPSAHNPVVYARSVRCPTLVFHGGQDARVSEEEAGSVFRNVPARTKTMHVFRSAGHEVFARTRSAEWRAIVRAHLSSVGG